MIHSISQKVKIYLKGEDLVVAVMDSLKQDRLSAILTKMGIEFPGKRMSNIPKEELALALAEESYVHPEIMDELIKILNKCNQDEIDRIKLKSIKEIKGYLEDIEDIFYTKRIGNVLWALLCDEREEVNNLVKDFMRHFLKMQTRLERMQDCVPEVSKNEPELKKIFGEKVEDLVSHVGEEIKTVFKESEVLKEKNRRLTDEIKQLQVRVQELQRLNGQLSNEKGVLKREKEKFLQQIDAMKREINVLKERIHTAPKVQLVSQLHSIEKENKKLMYELERERNEARMELERYKGENTEFRERLSELQKMTYRLEEELSIERQRVIDIQQEMKSHPPLPSASNVTSLHRGKRLGIFVDGQNIYHSAKLYYGKKLDHGKLISAIIRDRHLVKGIYYLIEQPNLDYEKFINMLKALGYTVKSRNLIRRPDGSLKISWDIGIAADIINSVEKNNLDIVAIVTCDSDFVDLIRLLRTKGIKVEIVGFEQDTTPELKNIADEFYPIEDELMLATL